MLLGKHCCNNAKWREVPKMVIADRDIMHTIKDDFQEIQIVV